MLPRVSTALMHFLRIVNPILSNCAPKRNSHKILKAQLVTHNLFLTKIGENYLNPI